MSILYKSTKLQYNILHYLVSGVQHSDPIFFVDYNPFKGFPGGSEVKNPPAMQEMWVWFLSQEDPLEKEMAIHSSILPWRIPWTEEPCGLQLDMTVAKSTSIYSYYAALALPLRCTAHTCSMFMLFAVVCASLSFCILPLPASPSPLVTPSLFSGFCDWNADAEDTEIEGGWAIPWDGCWILRVK